MFTNYLSNNDFKYHSNYVSNFNCYFMSISESLISTLYHYFIFFIFGPQVGSISFMCVFPLSLA